MTGKIKVTTPIVEIDGDEMTRVMWQMVKDQLITPYLDIETDYYDLGIANRDKTDDRITIDAAQAIKRRGVGVKCATITPDAARVKEFGLKKQWKSPNGTIRGILDGTVFRQPILAKNIPPAIRNLKRPICVGRHAHGDVYQNQEIRAEGPGTAELVFTPTCGEPVRKTIAELDGPGILQGIHNTDRSIASFARACFSHALSLGFDVWFSTKDTISKTYDARFRDIFAEEYESNWRTTFESTGLQYFCTLIDDAIARIVKSEGGILWALKNYDGDVMSDMLASACGSLAMMTSVLVSPDGYFEYEAAHGTVQKHYARHTTGEKTSTNSTALIFAWAGCLRKRGDLDGTPDVAAFADRLENATLGTIEQGIMTGDLMRVAVPDTANRQVTTEEFIRAVRERL
jgi:isocitrate dehydrogenase